MTKVKIKVSSEDARVVVSQAHQSLCMIVKERGLVQESSISGFGIDKRVEPDKTLANPHTARLVMRSVIGIASSFQGSQEAQG